MVDSESTYIVKHVMSSHQLALRTLFRRVGILLMIGRLQNYSNIPAMRISAIILFIQLLAGSGTLLAQSAATQTAPQMAPPFVFRSVDDTTRFISSETLAGKIYLVDFWATWCPPCVEALPGLQEIHEEFSSRGFTVVSLSFDASDERIRTFRQKRFSMPWLHGRLNGGFNDIIALTFSLQNIPHYVLVNRDGSVIAEGNDIHSERLRELLKAHGE